MAIAGLKRPPHGGLLWWSCNGEGAPLAYRMFREGFPVTLFFSGAWNRECRQYEGLMPQVQSTEEAIALRPTAVFFDSVSQGAFADAIFKPYVPTFGAAAVCDVLEKNRGWGIEVMHEHGIRHPETFVFSLGRGGPWKQAVDGHQRGALHYVRGHLEDAKQVVQAIGGRWVLKPYEAESSAETFVSHSPEEMIEHLDTCREQEKLLPDKGFILQVFMPGVEISTEMFLHRGVPIPGSVNAMFERKKFLVGDLGPNTGGMNAVVFPYQGWPRVWQETIGRPPFLAWLRAPRGPDGEQFAPYSGPFETNCIIAEDDHLPYALEWGPRPGYPSSFAWAETLSRPLGEVLLGVARGNLEEMPVRPGFGYTALVSIPPFPGAEMLNKTRDFGFVYRKVMELAAGIGISGPMESMSVWPIDVRLNGKGDPECAGMDGIIMNVSGHGATIEQARDASHDTIKAFDIENWQARLDDGPDNAIEAISKLRAWGYDAPQISNRMLRAG